MIRTASPRTVRLVALVASGMLVAAVLGLTGCSAGQITQTSSQVAAVNGVSARVGDVLVRNAQIEFVGTPGEGSAYPRGGDAPLQMAIINEGTTGDRLISVSSPVAADVLILGDTDLPAGQVLAVGNLRGSGAVAVSNTNQLQVILFNLAEDLKPGGITYPVVLVFERAGVLRLDLPVGNPAEVSGGIER